jgi:hypothetical protein
MHANILPDAENLRGRGAGRAILLVALSLVVSSAKADSLQIVGYSGYLGEWELTATVAEDGSTAPKKYLGQLSMKHVGLCTQDGPEERSGRIRVQMPSASRVEATLSLDGVECGYQGVLSDFYSGTMNCPGRERVPLKLWITESK